MGDEKTPDLGPDADWISRYFALDPNQPLLPEDGFRLIPTTKGDVGYKELIHLAEGFDLVIGNVRHEQPLSITSTDTTSALKFLYRLSGDGGIAVGDSETVPISRHTNALLLSPRGVAKHEHFDAGDVEQSVTLICTRQYLKKRIGVLGNDLPNKVQRYLGGEPADFFSTAMPLRAEMAQAANALISCSHTGPLRRMYAEAKALELLFHSIQALIEAEQGADRPDRGLTRRDVECIWHARKILEENFVEPPTIGELARRVGVNSAKLMHSFKQLFGQTVFDFSQALRMEKAKTLLEKTDLSVTEIAFEVGYEYSSNFTTAFKRHFGITPKVSRQGHRL